MQIKLKIEFTFKIKTVYYLELLTPETIKLLGSTKNNITKDKNGESLPHFKIPEIVLVHCNVVDSDYQQDSRVLYTFVPNKPFGSLLNFFSKKSYLFKNISFRISSYWSVVYRSMQSTIGNRR